MEAAAKCPAPCADDPAGPVSAVQAALLVVLAVLLVCYLAKLLGTCLGGEGRGEGFASRRALEVHDRARAAFEEGGGEARYSSFKNKVPGADPVLYADVRGLYRAGRLTPEAVEKVLG